MKFTLKLFLIIIAALIFTGFFFPVLAATATPSSDSKAQDLLDRVATKVAEIAKNFQRPFTGQITSIGGKSIRLSTNEGERTVLVLELTNYYRLKTGARSSIELSGLKIGDDISAIGTLDPSTNELTAKQIIAKTQRVNISGTIAGSDAKKGLFTIDTLPNPTVVEVDLNIPIKKIASDGAIIKSKYADLKNAKYLWVIGYFDTANKPNLTALKILAL